MSDKNVSSIALARKMAESFWFFELLLLIRKYVKLPIASSTTSAPVHHLRLTNSSWLIQ